MFKNIFANKTSHSEEELRCLQEFGGHIKSLHEKALRDKDQELYDITLRLSETLAREATSIYKERTGKEFIKQDACRTVHTGQEVA
ncbi:MAG: hypothetical protein AB7S81_06975 [Bdellovibrionales bacterium]